MGKKGITIIGDLGDFAGELYQDHGFNVNILEYYSAKKMVVTVIGKHSRPGELLLTKSYIPFHI